HGVIDAIRIACRRKDADFRAARPQSEFRMPRQGLNARTQVSVHAFGSCRSDVPAQVCRDPDEVVSRLGVQTDFQAHCLGSTAADSSSLKTSPRLARSRAGLRIANSSSVSVYGSAAISLSASKAACCRSSGNARTRANAPSSCSLVDVMSDHTIAG